MKIIRYYLVGLAGLTFASLAMAELKVAALHPILGDLARQIGGTSVSVVDLLKPGQDVHHFEPSARTLGDARDAKIVLASGKHLEGYLDKLHDNLGPNVKIVEVGRLIPSLKISVGSEVFMCCPAHAAGGIDPHWWHSADNMQRAARIVADEFAAADPANKEIYKSNSIAVQQKFAELKSWAQQQLAQISKNDRKLVTGHASFGYFCKEFGFKTIPVLGISREDSASPQYVTDAVKIIRENKIRAVFPEDQANPKVLLEITRETGAKAGQPLIADGTSITAHTFEAMLKHNVNAIVAALKP
ncbi:MAG: metal ABC transporter substrate-binding protein [Verrucomicrobia bacterium]|nr:metal ABC transporter substrate-binding protein [Verrucomicrobiota bacterium]